MRVVIDTYTATCAAGTGLAAMQESIVGRRTGLRRNDLDGCDLNTWIGRVEAVERVELPTRLGRLQSRNNQLAWLGLQQDGLLGRILALRDRLGAERIGVIIGTSTSSIARTEEAYTRLTPSDQMQSEYCQPEVHSLHSPGLFVAEATELEGPAMTISTACSSSAKVFAAASRWICHGLVDAVLVGGVDSLCMSIMYGFNSLELVSEHPCRPLDVRRDGINIGEACGYALLARDDLVPDAQFVLLGYGESSDAYHMSHPHPEGRGAAMSMQLAMGRAGLDAGDIDYINMHGTATPANDRVESLALRQIFSQRTLAASTKGWTGHTLGAAGILEAAITLESMRHGLLPGTLNCEQADPEMAFPVLVDNVEKPVRHGMTNSFGFGGNNATLIFGHAND